MKNTWKMSKILLDKLYNFLKKLKIQYMEKNMANSTYQGDCLDYKEVQTYLNKLKGNKNKNKLVNLLINSLADFHNKFNSLPEEKKQETLKSDKFKQLHKDISNKNNEELNKIMESMMLTDFDILSKELGALDDKIDRLDHTVVDIRDRYIQPQGGNIDDIIRTVEPIPKHIDNKINKLHADLSNSNKKLSKLINNINIPIPEKTPNDYLKKDDFEFSITTKLKDLKEIKESSENLEIIPAKVISIENKLKNLSEKMDNLPASNSFQTPKHIPKEEKSVIELAKYITDGIAQFENIAKEYISKISELEKLDKIKEAHQKNLEKTKKDEFEKGKESGKFELIKNIAEKFPTKFKDIKSTFEDLLEEKFKKDEILEINDKNLNQIRSFIKDNIKNGEYKVISPALLVDKEILFKACVEKVD